MAWQVKVTAKFQSSRLEKTFHVLDEPNAAELKEYKNEVGNMFWEINHVSPEGTDIQIKKIYNS